MDPLRLALIGCGSFGRHLARFADALPALELTALCDPAAHARDRTRQLLGRKLPGAANPEALADRHGDAFDAVLVCSPNHLHCDHTLCAAAAGKHVFCEKPMAVTLAECRHMVQATNEARVKLMVGHKRRLRPPFVRLRELACGGLLGPPLAVQIDTLHYHAHLPAWWLGRRTCGGLLHLVGVHDIDIMRAILGDVDTVAALSIPKLTGEADFDECMAVHLRFRSGAIGSLQAGFRFAPFNFRESCAPRVQCRDGAIAVHMHTDRIDLDWGRTPNDLRHESYHDLGHDAAFDAELASFAAWVTDGATPVLTWEEGLHCVEVMEAAYASAAQDGTPIRLDTNSEHRGQE